RVANVEVARAVAVLERSCAGERVGARRQRDRVRAAARGALARPGERRGVRVGGGDRLAQRALAVGAQLVGGRVDGDRRGRRGHCENGKECCCRERQHESALTSFAAAVAQYGPDRLASSRETSTDGW